MEKDNKEHPVVLINGYKGTDLDCLFNIINEIETENWSQALIICTTYDILDHIKAYDKQNYRLFTQARKGEKPYE